MVTSKRLLLLAAGVLVVTALAVALLLPPTYPPDTLGARLSALERRLPTQVGIIGVGLAAGLAVMAWAIGDRGSSE